MPGHDIITVGASAGGVELLLDLVPRLPEDLAASVFVVIHTSPDPSSLLPELLSAHGPLPAVHTVHGDSIVPGRIYVAPPDNQMLIRRGFIDVVRGPKENGHRPAVDATFRSAARAYGSRVIGVILSGYLDCGTAGIMSIKARGGMALVQAPETAAAPDMPRSVLRRSTADHVFRPAELPDLLARLVEEPAPGTRSPPPEIEGARGQPARCAGDGGGLPAVPGRAHRDGGGRVPPLPLPRRARVLAGEPGARADGGDGARPLGDGAGPRRGRVR